MQTQTQTPAQPQKANRPVPDHLARSGWHQGSVDLPPMIRTTKT